MVHERTMESIALYASPECCKSHNLSLYKGYFNVAWFVHAYAPLLARCKQVFVTQETLEAVTRPIEDSVDNHLTTIGAAAAGKFKDKWMVPAASDYRHAWGIVDPTQEATANAASLPINWQVLGDGFESQVHLAATVAKGTVERVLMFQDPDDVYSHLPEAYALIRNCTLANVSLNINAGATLWAEFEWRKLPATPQNNGYGDWRTSKNHIRNLMFRPDKDKQTIAFIAHDDEKDRMSRFVYHYRNELNSKDFTLSGTAGTCEHALNHLKAKDTPHWEMLDIKPAGAADGSGHGPTGGDVVIADQIIDRWTRKEDESQRKQRVEKLKECAEKVLTQGTDEEADEYAARVRAWTHRMAYKLKPLVRDQGITHTVLFFIDHKHAQPHQADIHVLLRTCLHPAHGVHLLLNERTVVEWGQMLHDWGADE